MPKSQPKKDADKKPKAAPAKAEKSAPKAAAKAPKADAVKAEAPEPPRTNGRPVPGPKKEVKLTPFLKTQREKLQLLRDTMLDSMAGVAKDTLRSRPEGSEASAFGMHQADAGSDAYDKDFALSLLSQEQDALYEIEEAIKRIDNGTYGICEMSGKAIPAARLEALQIGRASCRE